MSDDSIIVTSLDYFDPRTPHTEDLRWYLDLADGSQIEFIGRIHTELGTRVYSHQTAEQLACTDWIHHEMGGAEHIQGTAVGQTVSFRAVEGSIYTGRRHLWVAPAPTVAITCRDTSQVRPTAESSWWYCETTRGQWIEEQLPGEWDWTKPMGSFGRLGAAFRRPFWGTGLKQVGETLRYQTVPYASEAEAWQEDGPLNSAFGEIIHSFPVIDPALWPKEQA